MATDPAGTDGKGGSAAPRNTRQFYAETYKDGVHAAGWFETWDAGQKWCDSQKPQWWQITSREHIEAEVKRQDAILKSMGAPKIQRWVKR